MPGGLADMATLKIVEEASAMCFELPLLADKEEYVTPTPEHPYTLRNTFFTVSPCFMHRLTLLFT